MLLTCHPIVFSALCGWFTIQLCSGLHIPSPACPNCAGYSLYQPQKDGKLSQLWDGIKLKSWGESSLQYWSLTTAPWGIQQVISSHLFCSPGRNKSSLGIFYSGLKKACKAEWFMGKVVKWEGFGGACPDSEHPWRPLSLESIISVSQNEFEPWWLCWALSLSTEYLLWLGKPSQPVKKNEIKVRAVPPDVIHPTESWVGRICSFPNNVPYPVVAYI